MRAPGAGCAAATRSRASCDVRRRPSAHRAGPRRRARTGLRYVNATSRRPELSPRPPLAEQVARSLDATPALLRYFPELFADLWALGSQPAAIVELVGSLGLPHAAHAVDLGCGKGAVTVALAERLGIAATGVDAFSAFVEEARRRAAEHGVADRCAFVCDDLRRFTGGVEPFDLALLVGVGDVLGGLAETVGSLRACVSPGGYMLIDEGFTAAGPLPGYENVPDHAEALRQLTSHGDRLVREVVRGREEQARLSATVMCALRNQVERLAREYPHDASALRAYVMTGEQESSLLGDALIAATWVLERAG